MYINFKSISSLRIERLSRPNMVHTSAQPLYAQIEYIFRGLNYPCYLEDEEPSTYVDSTVGVTMINAWNEDMWG